MDHHEENEKMGRLSSLGETYKREEVAQAASALFRPDVLIEVDAIAVCSDLAAASRGQPDI